MVSCNCSPSGPSGPAIEQWPRGVTPSVPVGHVENAFLNGFLCVARAFDVASTTHAENSQLFRGGPAGQPLLPPVPRGCLTVCGD